MAGRDSLDKIQGFVDRHELSTIPHIPDSDNNELWLSFGVRGQPAWALVRADGEVEIGFGGIPDELMAEAAGV
jgi:hypothetical protein